MSASLESFINFRRYTVCRTLYKNLTRPFGLAVIVLRRYDGPRAMAMVGTRLVPIRRCRYGLMSWKWR